VIFLTFMKIKINGVLYENPNIKDGTLSILQACEEFGFNIPRYCYHQKLSIAGNCRMCLVELEGAPKPVASCAVMQTAATSVFLDSTVARKAREGVMEFLLLNHPLDCPICDQAGECDLQDQAMLVGSDIGRYSSQKRAVNDKEVGPLVKMVMTRCIHCTRCVRFATEVSGVEDFGVTGRGSAMEIGPYIQKVLLSELSGNVIDLCPVGALTSKPYAFQNRPWELTSVDSVDTTDSMGSSITVQVAPSSGKITRILPKSNDLVNGDWITDKTRFSYDAVSSSSRLFEPRIVSTPEVVKVDAPSTLTPVNFKDLHAVWAASTFPKIVSVGSIADALSIFNLKRELSTKVKNVFYGGETSLGGKVNSDFRTTFTFSSTLFSFEKSDFSLVIGSDLRREFPILHARLLSMSRSGVRSHFLGTFVDSVAFRKSHLGTSSFYLDWIRNGVNSICSVFQSSQNPSILYAQPFNTFFSQASVSSHLVSIAQYTRIFTTKLLGLNVYTQWAGFNYLPKGANETFFWDIAAFHRHGSLLPTRNTFFLSGHWLSYQSEDIPFSNKNIGFSEYYPHSSSFISEVDTLSVKRIYHGTHSHEDSISSGADLLFPVPTSFEKTGWYVNLEGRFQVTQPTVKARRGRAMISAPQLLDSDLSLQSPLADFDTSYDWDLVTDSVLPFSRASLHWLSSEPLVAKNFTQYGTDLMTRSSVVMSKCEYKKRASNFFSSYIS
jgi:NADH-quinone oxidoreductase chain G